MGVLARAEASAAPPLPALIPSSNHPPSPLLALLHSFDQPYQIALYTLGVATEARRWHVQDYETALPGMTPEDVQVG